MFRNNEEIIKELVKGNREAFEYIFNAYSSKVFYLSLKYTKNQDDADDCVQEIFLKMLDKIHTYNPRKATFATWLYRLASNYLIDRQRLAKIHNDCLCLENEAVDLAKEESNSFIHTELSQIEKLVGEKKYRIIMLKIGFEMSFNEVAKETGLSESTVKRIYKETLEEIREFIKRGENV